MSLLTSPPDGLQQLGWRRIVLTALAFCLAPAVIGGIGLAAVRLFDLGGTAEGAFRAEMLTTLALISPLIGVPVWAAIAAGTWWLLRRGSYGWLPAALLGCLAFGVLMRAGLDSLILPIGAVSALLYRMALALQRPDAV